MRPLRATWIRFRNLFRTPQLHRDLDAELAAHLELHIADNLRAGMSPAEARRQALLKLGGLEQTKDRYRHADGFSFLESLLQDLRFAVRTLRKNPGFTALAILTLALGIGANAAIFCVVDAVLLRSLPFPRSSELVDISGRSTSFDIPFLNLSMPDVADLRSNASSFASLAMYQDSPKELTSGGVPDRIESSQVSEDFFSTLAVRPLLGRTFTAADMQPGVHSAVLNYSMWSGRFGGDAGIVGRSITLDDLPYTIIGVMPDLQSIGFASDSSVWTAFIPSNEDRTARDGFTVAVVARLKPGVTSARAQHELDLLSARLSASYPEAHPNWSLHLTPLKTFLLGDARTPLTVLFCAVGFVLLIACANVSSLFLSRNWSRQREFAIRLAIGAPRSAILRQLAVETFLVALAAGLCALGCAWGSLQGLRSILPPEMPRLQNLRLDGQVASFTLAASFIAAILSGVAPAFLSARGETTQAIKSAATRLDLSASRAGHGLLRRSLVIAEVALSVILLLGATLAVRSFSHLLHLDLGFKPDHVLTLHLDFPKFRYANSAQAITFVRQVLEGVRAVPGVNSASAGLVFPMSDEIAGTLFETEATASDPKLGEQSASANRVSPDFFRTLGIPLLAGRDFSSSDAAEHPLVFIVNETLARKYFGTIDVVGKRLSPRKESGHPIWGEIIGVAANVGDANLREEPKPLVYAAFYQTRIAVGVYLVVRSNLDPASIVPAIQQRIWTVEPHQPVTRVATLEQRISAVNAAPRSQSFLLGVFAMLGVFLALIGLYGVIAYMVSLQTHEIGVRMAIGATLAQILRLVLIQGIKVALPGIAIGIVGGIFLTRFMSSLLFGIGALDPLTFACVPFLLAFACLLACWIPARRATRVDPMIALRYE